MEIILPTAAHTHTVILLHGRDSTASEFKTDFFESQASDDRALPETFPGIKWVLPAANVLLSIRFGCKMSQWFGMWTTEDPHDRETEQQAQLDQAVDDIQKIVDQESKFFGNSKTIILGGISQGCAVSGHALLKQNRQLGGFIGLSGWLPLRETLTTAESNTLAFATPVFLAHCEDDDVVAIRYGEELREGFRSLGMNVSWRAYAEGGHWINEPKGVDDIVEFLHLVTR